MRSEKKDEQGNHQSPGQHTACKLKCSKTQPDDVSNSQISGAHAGSGEHAGSPSGHQVRASCCAQTNLTVAETADNRVEIFIGGEQTEASEHVHHTADANIPEEVFGSLRASLSGFVNLRCCDGFREGQLRILHHDPPH